MRADLDRLNDDLRAAQARNADLIATLARLEDEVRASHRAVDDLTATLNARDLEARDKDARLVDQDKDLQAARNHLGRVEGDCAHWRAKNDDAAGLHAQEARLLDEDRARNADL